MTSPLDTLLEEASRLDREATPAWKYEAERYSAKCVIGIKPYDDRWIANYQPEVNGENNALFSVFTRNHLSQFISIIRAQREALEHIKDAYMGTSASVARIVESTIEKCDQIAAGGE